jgi:site-specific recombinase XerD
MKRRLPTILAQSLQRFFQDYLPTQRGMSLHTIRGYRDAMLLFLRFMAKDTRQRIEALEITDFTVERVMRFLRHLEIDRHNSIKTRNARLAALHTFARFLIMSYPERMASCQRVLSIPFKRGAERRPVDYLEMRDVEALLNAVDQTTPSGRRDYALFALMLNTGARVQEILNLKGRDVRFDPPHQVRLLGKGNKVRVCPIWPRTAKLLQNLVSETDKSSDGNLADSCLFQNNRGEQLTRFGVRYLLRKYLPKPSGADGRHRGLHPHCIRHTTAVYLLKAGVDLATISQWLGHAGLNTTMHYARADMDLKRQALSQVFPETLAAPKGGRVRLDGTEISDWLQRL